MIVVVDASVWVSYLALHDPFHRKSTDWIDRYSERNGTFIAPILLLAEVAGAMARRYASVSIGQQPKEHLRALPELGLVPLNDVVGIRAADLAAQLQIRGADATYATVAQRAGVPLVSWDGEQLSRAAAVVSIFTPETAPLPR